MKWVITAAVLAVLGEQPLPKGQRRPIEDASKFLETHEEDHYRSGSHEHVGEDLQPEKKRVRFRDEVVGPGGVSPGLTDFVFFNEPVDQEGEEEEDYDFNSARWGSAWVAPNLRSGRPLRKVGGFDPKVRDEVISRIAANTIDRDVAKRYQEYLEDSLEGLGSSRSLVHPAVGKRLHRSFNSLYFRKMVENPNMAIPLGLRWQIRKPELAIRRMLHKLRTDKKAHNNGWLGKAPQYL